MPTDIRVEILIDYSKCYICIDALLIMQIANYELFVLSSKGRSCLFANCMKVSLSSMETRPWLRSSLRYQQFTRVLKSQLKVINKYWVVR